MFLKDVLQLIKVEVIEIQDNKGIILLEVWEIRKIRIHLKCTLKNKMHVRSVGDKEDKIHLKRYIEK